VVIGSENRILFCYNKADGKILWRFKALGKLAGSPVICGNNVVVAAGDGRLYVLDLQTGTKSWSYELGSPSASTPAVIKNMLVISTQDGRVFGFNLIQK
jgi:outer membrane protein assembly factor BamB